MSRAYSQDLRDRVIDAALKEDLSARAPLRGSGSAWQRQWSGCGGRVRRACGRQATRPAEGVKARRSSRGDPGLDRRKDDITIAEIQGPADDRAGDERRRWHGLELPRPLRPDVQKKTAHAAEQDRPDVRARREAWFDGQLDLDPARLIFIDETWASTNMARRRGRAMKGERLRSGVPHGHWKTTTFVAGLRSTGIAAPSCSTGRSTATPSRTYVAKVLVPELAKGDIVVMDNLSSHKGPRVREMIEAAGARLLYLPPYSPTSTPSKWPSPNSRRCCARQPSERSPRSGTRSGASSTSSRQPRPPTSSLQRI